MPHYACPTDLTEALALTQHGYRCLAGGTDLYPSAGQTLAGDIVDLTKISSLHGISADNGLRIGSCTTWSQIAEADLPPAFAALQQAARQIGGRQVQNAGTIGGNICNASPAADGLPALLVLDAELEIASPTSIRRIPVDQALIGVRNIGLANDEILVAIHIPAQSITGRSAFMKLGARRHLVISIAMCAIRLVIERGLITSASIAVGSCGPFARRMKRLELALIGAVPSEVVLDPDLIRTDLSPITDIRATATYRADAAVTLVRRLIMELAP